MDSVFSRLDTRYGIKLSAPGAKENGGIFVHPNPWAMIAETILAMATAPTSTAQLNPAAKNDMIGVYECEPHIYAQNVLGDEHPQFGLARNSWLTGTASWCYLVATQWILGIRTEFEGPRIDPCLPAVWDGFSAVRKFRACTFDIKVHNPQHVCRGVVDVRLGGERRQGAIIPPDLPGERHTVELWLGHPSSEECARQPAIGATEADPRETWRHGRRARRG